MILLKSITLKNFLSHSDTTLEFNENDKKLLDGVSGSGKSSIIDALLWCLYGKSRTDNRGLIKRGTKNTLVRVVIKDDEKEYRIERSYGAGKQNLDLAEKIDGKFKPVQIVGIKFIQEYIETKILKSSYLLFINSVAYPQDNQENFVKQTAEKRKDIILEIIHASDYDVYYDKAKEALKLLDLKTAGLEVEDVNLTTKIQENNIFVAAIPNYEKDIKEKKELLDYVKTSSLALEERKKKDDELKAKRIELGATYHFLSTNLLNVEMKKKITLQYLGECETVNLKDLEEKVAVLADWRVQIAALEIEREKVIAWDRSKMGIIAPSRYDWQPTIDGLIEKATKISMEPAKVCSNELCPYAATIHDDQKARTEEVSKDIEKYLGMQKIQREIELKYNNDILALGERPVFDEDHYNIVKGHLVYLAQYETELKKYAGLSEKINNFKKDIEECDASLLDINQKISLHHTEVTQLGEPDLTIDNDLNLSRQQTTNIQLEIQKSQMYLDSALEIQKQNVVIEAKMAEVKRALGEITKDKSALELIKEALGNKGIKSVIIDYVIPQLEDKINEVLARLSDFRVALETQKEGAGSDTVLDGLFITITNGQGEAFDLASYSGGERMRITTAISEGLASLQKTGFRIFDESIVGLDAATVEGFVEVLMQIQGRFNQVLCVSHLQPIKDLFEEKIVVVKKGADSSIQ